MRYSHDISHIFFAHYIKHKISIYKSFINFFHIKKNIAQILLTGMGWA